MKAILWLLAGGLAAVTSRGDDVRIASFSSNGALAVTNTFSQGAVTVERAAALGGPWVPERQAFSVGPGVQVDLVVSNVVAFFRVLPVDFSGAQGAWTFAPDDILDLQSLANELISPPVIGGVSDYLSWQLSPATVDLLFLYFGGPDLELQQALVNDFNQIITNGPVYDPQRFAGVTLSPPTQSLLAEDPQGSDLIRLNRLLLQDAYPLELRKRPPFGFTNLVESYGILSTVAGAGGTPLSPNNKWLPESEGGPATNAYLSRPHIAMADRTGNIYIADKEAHAIRKVTLDGNIHTVAGNNVAGFGSTNSVPATSVSLYNPNGLWVREDGTFYILDRDNGLIRKVDTNGLMTLMVDNGGAIPEGRGLWVSADESILYYSAGFQLKRWDSTNGLGVHADGFIQLGNLAVSPSGQLAVTDRGANRVYRVDADGTRTVIAGNGSSFGGGDGQLATETGLWQVRGIWFLPTGAFFLATDNGSQVWYVDTEGYIHLFLNGNASSHDGDGAWFYNPLTPKVSKVRQITMDYEGSLIITENDAGYIRKVRFLRLIP